MSEGTQADPALHGWVPRNGGLFSSNAGPFWARREGEGWAYGVLASAAHANAAGAVHGGLLMTLADNALGFMVWNACGRQPCVTAQLNTQFIAAAHPGDFIEARGEVLRRGGSLVFVRGMIVVGDRLVGAADGVWKVLTPRGTSAENGTLQGGDDSGRS